MNTQREMTELVTLHAPDEGRGHIHHRAGTPGSGHEPISEEFLERVAAALHHGSAEILIAGPAHARRWQSQTPSPKEIVMPKNKLQLRTEGDTHVIVTRRFNAPPQAVYRAHTEPALIQRWMLGPAGWTMPVCRIDPRPGGSFYYEWVNAA